MNPGDPKTDHMLTQPNAGGWGPQDWSPDDKKILLLEYISVNETYLWLVDTVTGAKSELTTRATTCTSVQVTHCKPRNDPPIKSPPTDPYY